VPKQIKGVTSDRGVSHYTIDFRSRTEGGEVAGDYSVTQGEVRGETGVIVIHAAALWVGLIVRDSTVGQREIATILYPAAGAVGGIA
jgi:hypothetical protein